MSDVLPAPVAADAPRRLSWQRLGGRFLVISVAAHLLFLALAAYYVVQRYAPPARRTFTPQGKGPNAPTRALELKVQQKKQKSAMSAPPTAKRVTSTGSTKLSLPAMPAMPSLASALSPTSLSGMGAGSLAPGSLGGGGSGGLGGAGGGVNFFGARTGGNGLTGTFYDLKQTSGRQPTNMTPNEFAKIVRDFARGGSFNLGLLARFFKAPKPLYATQIFTPNINANAGPAAFQMEKEVQPKMWLIHYKGVVSPPEDGVYHFVGLGDDYLLIKFNNKLVLDGSWQDNTTTLQPRARYSYPLAKPSQGGIAKGEPIEVRAGEAYPIEIVIAEQPGGSMMADLLIEKEGTTYRNDKNGNPLLPIFRLANSAPLPAGKFLPHEDTGPIWRSVTPKASDSIFSH